MFGLKGGKVDTRPLIRLGSGAGALQVSPRSFIQYQKHMTMQTSSTRQTASKAVGWTGSTLASFSGPRCPRRTRRRDNRRPRKPRRSFHNAQRRRLEILQSTTGSVAPPFHCRTMQDAQWTMDRILRRGREENAKRTRRGREEGSWSKSVYPLSVRVGPSVLRGPQEGSEREREEQEDISFQSLIYLVYHHLSYTSQPTASQPDSRDRHWHSHIIHIRHTSPLPISCFLILEKDSTNPPIHPPRVMLRGFSSAPRHRCCRTRRECLNGTRNRDTKKKVW